MAWPRSRGFGGIALLASVGGMSACQPGKFDDRPVRASADASGLDAGSVDASTSVDASAAQDASMDAARASEDAGPDASAFEGGGPADASFDATMADASPVSLTLRITDDLDDGLWAHEGSNVLDELLHFSPDDGAASYTLEVGTDGEACRTGLRFPLDIPRGATITSASLSLLRVGVQSSADPGSSMRVSVFETVSLTPIDHAHMHTDPSQHAPNGVWSGASVGGFHVGKSDARTLSPDLSVLVQHAIDQTGWQRGGYIGFLIVPDDMPKASYAQFRDSYGTPSDGPALSVTYLP